MSEEYFTAEARRQRREERLAAQPKPLFFERDPAPCFFCGEREGCKHRRAA